MTRRKLSDAIVDDFLRRISAGELLPGDPVPAEAALSASLGVGRSVVREALRGLAAKGFLEQRQGSATVVAPRHRWQVLDHDFLAVTTGQELIGQLQEARELFEPRIAGLAAVRADDEVIVELKALIERLADAGTQPDDHAAADIAFHEAIAAATGNAVLASLHHSIIGLGMRARKLSVLVPGSVDRAVFWHTQVLDAIAAHDSEAAEAAMRMHLRQVRGELEALHIVGNDGTPSGEPAGPPP